MSSSVWAFEGLHNQAGIAPKFKTLDCFYQISEPSVSRNIDGGLRSESERADKAAYSFLSAQILLDSTMPAMCCTVLKYFH